MNYLDYLCISKNNCLGTQNLLFFLTVEFTVPNPGPSTKIRWPKPLWQESHRYSTGMAQESHRVASRVLDNCYINFRQYTTGKKYLKNCNQKSFFCPTLFPPRWPIEDSRNTLYSFGR